MQQFSNVHFFCHPRHACCYLNELYQSDFSPICHTLDMEALHYIVLSFIKVWMKEWHSYGDRTFVVKNLLSSCMNKHGSNRFVQMFRDFPKKLFCVIQVVNIKSNVSFLHVLLSIEGLLCKVVNTLKSYSFRHLTHYYLQFFNTANC